MKVIDLQLNEREAHVVLRALASHNNDDTPKEDREPIRWVAQRLLRILSPDLGLHPIEAIHVKAEEAATPKTTAGKARRRKK